MTGKRVWLVQCLCPARHCIVATAGEATGQEEADFLREKLREVVKDATALGHITAWCALCSATEDTWHYETGETAFLSLADARPTLSRLELEQAVTQKMWADRPPGVR